MGITVPPDVWMMYPTAQHLEALHRKQQTLTQAIINSEEQLFANLARDYKAGKITCADLKLHYVQAQTRSVKYYSDRWLAAGLPSTHKLRWAERMTPPAEGYWHGALPLQPKDSLPLVDVVYLLFDEEGVVCYTGSSGSLRSRLKDHLKEKQGLTRWQAYPVPDRELAYKLEDRFLKLYKPYMNKRASR